MAARVDFLFDTALHIFDGIQIGGIWWPQYLDPGTRNFRFFAIACNVWYCIIINKQFFQILLESFF
jgi:hypothetical protein